MESAALRTACQMHRGQKGVLIRRVNPTSAAAEHLRADDVLMSFDGQAIACDGTVPFRTGERIAFSYLISNKFVGESARVVVLRDGQQQTLDIVLSRPGVLMPPHLSNKAPSYFVVSGVVFTVACEPYLESEYGAEWVGEAPIKLLDKLSEMPAQAGEEVVVVGQVLADEATLGYEDVSNMRVSGGGLVLQLLNTVRVLATGKLHALRQAGKQERQSRTPRSSRSPALQLHRCNDSWHHSLCVCGGAFCAKTKRER
eukprot:GHRQ01026626.1.p1 GENE.GHRQ01026626.1~~GHRQ01026626.1.p1  ORF type:complete len:256 (+),score=77.21 GHRQ01026626.1:318-1085(+)